MSKDSAPGKANSIVTFSEEYEQGSDNYIIFQVDDQFLKSLNDSKKLEIQGMKFNSSYLLALKMEDKAILITNDKTFSIQRREYSNTFLYTKQKNMEENQKNLEIIGN